MTSSFAYKALLLGLIAMAGIILIKQRYPQVRRTYHSVQTSPASEPETHPIPALVKEIDTTIKTEVMPSPIPVIQEKKVDTNETMVKPRFTKEWRGSYSGLSKPLQIIMRDIKTWEEFWKQFTSNRPEKVSAPEINFNRQMIIVLALGEQPSSDYKVEIQSISYEQNKVIVRYKETLPSSSGTIVSSIKSQPYHMKVVRANTSEVIFQRIP